YLSGALEPLARLRYVAVAQPVIAKMIEGVSRGERVRKRRVLSGPQLFAQVRGVVVGLPRLCISLRASQHLSEYGEREDQVFPVLSFARVLQSQLFKNLDRFHRRLNRLTLSSGANQRQGQPHPRPGMHRT